MEQAKRTFQDPWIRDDIIRRQLSIPGSPERKQDLRSQAVDLWLKEASALSGVKRTLFLEEALRGCADSSLPGGTVAARVDESAAMTRAFPSGKRVEFTRGGDRF